MIGINRLRRVVFDLTQPPLTFPEQAQQGIKSKLAQWQRDSIPTFGRPTGFVVNYALDSATEFDLHGNPIAALPEALLLGTASLAATRRDITNIMKLIPLF